MNYSIRLAEERDIPFLSTIEQNASTAFEGTEHEIVILLGTLPEAFLIEQMLDRLLWVAVDETDRPVGFAAAQEIGPYLHLHELSVEPEHSRRGLGRRLVAAVLDHATDAGYPAVTLSTFREIVWNAPFYQRLGFEILDESTLTEGLRAIREKEASFGLDITARVIMRKLL